MNEKVVQKYLLLIVIAVASLAVVTLLSSVLTTESAAVTGAAVRGEIMTLCKDNDGSNAENKGIVNVYYGSLFPDQCYMDEEASKDPVNTGRYLREMICDANEVSFKVYDCGTNKCQYGACVGSTYSVLE